MDLLGLPSIFLTLLVSEEEKERFSENLKNFDQYLGPYPYDSWKKWISLSNRLTGIKLLCVALN